MLVGIMLSKLISLSELSPRVGIALSMLVSLSEMSKGVILLNPNDQSMQIWVRNLQLNLKVIQRLMSLGSWFYRNRISIKLEF